MGTDVKRLVISGYYGFGNSGDEAVLLAMLQALERQGEQQGMRIEPIVLSIRPEMTSSQYGVRSVHRLRFHEVLAALRKSDGLISGGGSLLQDVTGVATIPYYLGIIAAAQLLGKPTFIYAQGIGPIRRPIFHRWLRSILGRSRYISVRDGESAALLNRMGISMERIETVPDPVMGLSSSFGADAAKTAGKTDDLPVIGVSVRFWEKNRCELQKLAQSLDWIKRRNNVKFRFLPFHLPADRQASQFVIDEMGSAAEDAVEIVQADHPADMLEQVGRCRLLIGMRLHSLIYAAVQKIPMVGITYDPKVDQFLQRLGMIPAASTQAFDVEQVGREALRLLEYREAWIDEKKTAIDVLNQEAQRPAQQIVSIIRNKG